MKPIEVDEFMSLLLEGYLTVDTRKSEVFLNGFLKESISIEFEENFVNTFQELVGISQKVLLITEENDIPAVLTTVKSAGITNIYGYLIGFDTSKIPSKAIDMLIAIDSEELGIDYRFDEFFLIDVRTSEEFETEHVEHAENILLSDLEQLLVDFDTAGSYYIYADSPNQAIIAGSIFKRSGFHLVKVIAESFVSIKASGIPLVDKNKKSSSKFSNN